MGRSHAAEVFARLRLYPIFITVSVGIVIAIPIGYKLSERLHPKWIKRLLALLVSVAGLFALIKGIFLTGL
jgi:uncharacterized membrane protein YfcA